MPIQSGAQAGIIPCICMYKYTESFGPDAERALYFANEIQAGQVSVNGIVKSDPRLPSGGIKRSGFGRELGPHGIREFTNAKQIWIK